MRRRNLLATILGIGSLTIAGCGDTDTGNGNGNGNGGGDGGGNGAGNGGGGDDSAADDSADEDGEADDGSEDTETPEEAPEEQSFQGTGQTVSDPFTIDGGLTVFELTHDGSSNFQVELIDEESGDTTEFLANEIGSWQAIQPFNIPSGEYVFDINADGEWTIDVAQPRPASSDSESPPANLSDEYPNYLGPIQFDGRHTITGEYQGDSNFAVWVLNEDGDERDLIFNEIGQFEGEGSYSGNHVGYIRVESTGQWTVQIE